MEIQGGGRVELPAVLALTKFIRSPNTHRSWPSRAQDAQYAAGAILRADWRPNPPILMGKVATFERHPVAGRHLLNPQAVWSSLAPCLGRALLQISCQTGKHCSKKMVTSWPSALDQQLPCTLQIGHPRNLPPEVTFHNQSLLGSFLNVLRCSYW